MEILVTVAIPVFNGEKYIRQAINSVINQTYKNIEIVICDNYSSDKTWEICQEYAAKDKRFRLYKNEENIGIFKNFERTVELANGKYFMWLAADDRCEPDLVYEQCRFLENDPDVLICASDIKVIDEEGNYLYDMKLERLYPENAGKNARYEFFKSPPTNSYMAIYGMYVTDKIKEFGVVKPVWKGVTLGSEHVYLAKYALNGKVQALQPSLKIARMQKNSVSHQETRIESLSDFVLRTLQIRWRLTKVIFQSKTSVFDKAELFCVANFYTFVAVIYYCPRYILGTIKKGLLKKFSLKENFKEIV
jgi:glycosyltransferase involved in cell wall biosynthesis